MARRTILMLGEDEYAVRACDALGIGVTVLCAHADRDFALPAQGATRRVSAQDPAHPEAVLAALHRAGIDPGSFDALYAADENAIVTAAVLSAVFDLRTGLSDAGLPFRDKALAKRMVRGASIKTTRFDVLEDLAGLPKTYGLPFSRAVLKPVDGSAPHCTSVVESAADLQAQAALAQARIPRRPFILEEFTTGDEWHVDGVVHQGSLLFASVSGHKGPCLESLIKGRPVSVCTFDPVQDAPAYELAMPFVERTLHALGMESGVFHMKVFYDEAAGTLTFGECAARRGGGLVEEQVLLKFGVSLARAAIQCALGEKPVIGGGARPGSVGLAFLPDAPGTLVSHPSVDELIGLPDVVSATIDAPLGYRLAAASGTRMEMGQILLRADDRETLSRRIEQVVAWFTERTIAIPDNMTTAQLRSWSAGVSTTSGGITSLLNHHAGRAAH